MLAITSGTKDGINIGLVGVSLAYGLTVMTMAFAVGPVSRGGQFNPAVSIGLLISGRFGAGMLAPYIVSQVVGAVAVAAVLAIIVTGNGSEIGTLTSNGFDDASPGGYSLYAVLITEVVMMAASLFIILGFTDERSGAAAGFAPAAIGLGLTLIHLISIPVSDTSVDPARSTGPVLISLDGTAIAQLWVFWAAPIVGAALSALLYKTTLIGGKYDSGARTDESGLSN